MATSLSLRAKHFAGVASTILLRLALRLLRLALRLLRLALRLHLGAIGALRALHAMEARKHILLLQWETVCATMGMTDTYLEANPNGFCNKTPFIVDKR